MAPTHAPVRTLRTRKTGNRYQTASRPDPGVADIRQQAAADQERAKRRHELIAAHMPMAARIAHGFAGRGEDLDDLTQVAMLGLIKAADRFDASRGTAFAQYAYPCILGELKKYFRDSGWSMHVTRRMQELHLQINRAMPLLTQQLGRTPTLPDLAAHLRLSEEDVELGLNTGSAYNTRSLESPAGDHDAIELGQLIGQVDERMEAVPDLCALRLHVAELPARQQKILQLRFFADLTQSEIAKQLGISQMHVSRLLAQSMELLRNRMLATA